MEEKEKEKKRKKRKKERKKVMTDYVESGKGGDASKTKQGKKQAKSCFDLFTSSLLVPLPSFDLLNEEQLCNISLMRKFGTYLITTARDSRAGELLMRDSALQYMSGVKTAAFERFPDNQMFKKGHDDWYSALRGDIEKKISNRCNELGI